MEKVGEGHPEEHWARGQGRQLWWGAGCWGLSGGGGGANFGAAGPHTPSAPDKEFGRPPCVPCGQGHLVQLPKLPCEPDAHSHPALRLRLPRGLPRAWWVCSCPGTLPRSRTCLRGSPWPSARRAAALTAQPRGPRQEVLSLVGTCAGWVRSPSPLVAVGFPWSVPDPPRPGSESSAPGHGQHQRTAVLVQKVAGR